MHVLIGGFGTRGDVQPMLALAIALRERGHHITFMAPPDFAAWAEQWSLPFAAVGPDMGAFLAQISDGHGGFKLSAATREVPAMMRTHFAAMEPLVAQADVVVAASLTVAGASLAEKYGKRYHYVAYCPQAIPSGEHPLAFVKSQALPQWLNRLTFALGTLGHKMMMSKVIDVERKRLGLKPVDDAWGHILFQRLILASEPALAPLPADLPKKYEVVQPGAFFLPEPGELPAGLPDGAVFVGFGSMQAADRELSLEAGRLAGVKVLLGSELGVVPHGKLFPRCAAVVHHGGAGTTAQTARCGVPQVVVPHVTDQFYWGDRLHHLGVAPPPIPRTKLTALNLAEAIKASLSMHAAAAALAKKTIADGTTRAAELIERSGDATAPAHLQ